MTRAPKLASGRSPRWAFMERFEIPNYDSDGNYLTRWRIVQTPWFGVYLHRFDGPDPRDTLHDHPWNFLSIVLRGGYVERRLNPMSRRINEAHRVTRFNYLRAGVDAHAITRLLRTPTWTLMFVGKRVRTWGYIDFRYPIADGHPKWWIEWSEFSHHWHAREFDAAMERRKERANG